MQPKPIFKINPTQKCAATLDWSKKCFGFFQNNIFSRMRKCNKTTIFTNEKRGFSLWNTSHQLCIEQLKASGRKGALIFNTYWGVLKKPINFIKRYLTLPVPIPDKDYLFFSFILFSHFFVVPEVSWRP